MLLNIQCPKHLNFNRSLKKCIQLSVHYYFFKLPVKKTSEEPIICSSFLLKN